MTTETVRTLVLVAIPVVVTGAWVAADIIATERELRRDRQAIDAYHDELAARRAAPATGERGHG